ncbi:(d)CMP kinase [Anaerococcus sp. Marseille-P3625]|uniref:(d)CMP kinase n=1 Tax=Anaerococcus sp. Marseille-P3625 TaxID=1977277 RepID=UPI000C074E2B|nr:(d)CMP kinase [Anaerococcus sp. Marseille-P3625]
MTYIIAIDGPSGSGKSTISQKLAEILKIEYLNTGSMYRAVSKYFLDNNIKENSTENEISIALNKIKIDFINNEIYLNGENIESLIRTDLVTKNTSWVSANKIIRENLVAKQRQIASTKSFVVDGRDIGTVVFPNAKYKFYLTASTKERAKRRFLQKESNLSIEEIEEALIKRDLYDSSRAISPLKKADDALEIDNSKQSIEQTLQTIISYMDKEDVL